tara:strand:- start:91 stop:393 length:303 start_codon:yes stop_codon:yes gene_type:complete
LSHRIKEYKYYFDQADKLDSSDPLVLGNKGIYLSAINKILQAILCFEKVTSLNSSIEFVYFYYAIVLLQNNEYKKAIHDLKISAAKGEQEANEKLIKLGD